MCINIMSKQQGSGKNKNGQSMQFAKKLKFKSMVHILYTKYYIYENEDISLHLAILAQSWRFSP